MFVPGDEQWAEFCQAVTGIEYEPEKVLDDPEQHQRTCAASLQFPGEYSIDGVGQVEGQEHEREDPGVVAGHGASAPEDVQ